VLDAQRAALQQHRPGAPFALLLPAWSASKLGWRQLLWALAALRVGKLTTSLDDAARGERAERAGAFSERLEEAANVFYVVPSQR
jgi:hypothetical protein